MGRRRKLFSLTRLLLIFEYVLKTQGVQSDTCWDGVNSIDYTGNIAVTSTGRTCQAWASDTPQAHTLHGTTYFPYDGDDVAASNYCRDPDASGGPWCYTMDIYYRWEFCTVPICYNFPCVGSTVSGQSDPSTLLTYLDTYTGINYLQKAVSPYGFSCCGTIEQWRVFIRNSGTIRFQVWRLNTGTGNYVLKGENVYTYAAGDINTRHDETVPQSDRITVQEGDLMGWYTAGSDMVSFDVGTTNQVALLTTTVPSVGDSVDFSGAAIGNSRDYAIGAVVTPNLPPYFDNTVSSISVPSSEAVGNTIHTLTVSDDDTDDVSSLVISVKTNSYFDITGHSVVVKASLVPGTVTLDFTVKDQCSNTGTFTLTVTVTPPAITLTSLPTTESVLESETSETLIHTLIFNPTDTYTCSLDAYTPTRPEGIPFLVQNTPTSDIGIYLKNLANIRYSVTTSYNVTVTCSNAVPSSVTTYLIINVDPNTPPVFTSFQSSLTIDASTTSINDIVYTATITDTDPVAVTLTSDPSPCPFYVNNNGEISITSDPRMETQTTYTFILTANDGYNAVKSPNISVIITNLNVKPVITNLPASTRTVMENQAAGTSVFLVSQSDANGDTPTFYATYSSTTCASMYEISSTAGSITTLVSLNYETHPSCTLTITVSDGKATSDPKTLTIDVGNQDEPPVLSSSGYVISTKEVVSGTALSSAGISATDPEGTAVTLSLSTCGANTGYLTIHSTTGIVTMATAFDLETAGSNPYTITCVVKATDATSQTSTSSLNVIISDANDNQPVFSPAAYSFYITEGHTGFNTIGTVTARDADVTLPNKAIIYTISPTTSFSISGSGIIQNTVDLSGVAAGTTYTLTVTATDGGTPPLSGTATVDIFVLSATTTTTTTATAAVPTAPSTGTSSDRGFFSDSGNIVFFAIAVFTAAMMSALVGFLIWRYCCKSSSQIGHITPVKQNEGKFQGQEYPKKINNANGHIGKEQPNKVPQFETDRPEVARSHAPTYRRPQPPPPPSPEHSDRPDSDKSVVSVSSVPLRMSAVQSVKRTNWLTDSVNSPRSMVNLEKQLKDNSNMLSLRNDTVLKPKLEIQELEYLPEVNQCITEVECEIPRYRTANQMPRRRVSRPSDQESETKPSQTGANNKYLVTAGQFDQRPETTYTRPLERLMFKARPWYSGKH